MNQTKILMRVPEKVVFSDDFLDGVSTGTFPRLGLWSNSDPSGTVSWDSLGLRLRYDTTTLFDGAQVYLSTTVGNTYSLSVDIDLADTPGVQLEITRNDTGAVISFNGTYVASGTYTLNFVAQSPVTRIKFYRSDLTGASEHFFVGNFSVSSAVSYWLDTYQTEPFPINYQLADIREIDKSHSAYTKTVVLPGSKNNNLVFQHVFGLTVENTFDLRRKADVQVFADGVPVLDGFLQLVRVDLNRRLETVDYEVVIYGKAVDLIGDLGELKFTDLDFTDLLHVKDAPHIINSWTAGWTNGYVYPLVDYGYDLDYDQISTNTPGMTPSQMRQAVYVRTIVDKIFAKAGYTYTSSFFNSPHFLSLVALSPDVIIPYSGRYDFKVAWLTRSQDFFGGIGVHVRANMDDDVNPPYFDTDNTWDTTLFQHTVPVSSIAQFNMSFTTDNTQFPSNFTVSIIKEVSGVQTTVVTKNYLQSTSTPVVDVLSTGDILVTPGELYYVEVIWNSGFTPVFYNNFAGALSYFEGIYKTPLGGNSGFKLSDFIVGLVKMFNLYIEPDRDNQKNLLIEPRDDYYSSSTVNRDWTHKLDASVPIWVELMSEIQNQKFAYSYLEDKDFYNTDYKTQTQRVYGDYLLEVDNDFVKGQTTIQTTFYPTPMASMRKGAAPNVNDDLVVPKIGAQDNFSGVWSGTDFGMRILYYKYVPIANGSQWYFDSTVYTSYPYAGHFDDPYNASKDLNYGRTPFYYFNQSLTNNNLFKVYYGNQMDEIDNIDAKLVTMYFDLQPRDMLNLRFNDRIFVEGIYYRLNKVIDYDPNTINTTQVELIKTLDMLAFGGVFDAGENVVSYGGVIDAGEDALGGEDGVLG